MIITGRKNDCTPLQKYLQMIGVVSVKQRDEGLVIIYLVVHFGPGKPLE